MSCSSQVCKHTSWDGLILQDGSRMQRPVTCSTRTGRQKNHRQVNFIVHTPRSVAVPNNVLDAHVGRCLEGLYVPRLWPEMQEISSSQNCAVTTDVRACAHTWLHSSRARAAASRTRIFVCMPSFPGVLCLCIDEPICEQQTNKNPEQTNQPIICRHDLNLDALVETRGQPNKFSKKP